MSRREGDNWSYIYKTVTVGDKNVGKSSILTRIVTQQFDQNIRATLGVDHHSTIAEVGGDRVKVQLWDTSGNSRFRSMTRIYFRGAPAAMIVYDISDRGSFENVPQWLSEVREHAVPEVAVMLIGNKLDLEHHGRAVTTADGAEFARAHHLMFMETSALSDTNVAEAFRRLIEQVHQVRQSMDCTERPEIPDGASVVDLQQSREGGGGPPSGARGWGRRPACCS